MNKEEVREIIDNMSEQELNDFIFFALQEVEKENQKLKTEIEKKDIDIIEAKEANRQLSVELQKKDKIIDEIEDLCIRKGDDEGEEYGEVFFQHIFGETGGKIAELLIVVADRGDGINDIV